MGANGLKSAQNDQSLQHFQTTLEQDYLLLPQQHQEAEDIKWYVHKSTQQNFVLKKVHSNSQQQALAYHEIVLRKIQKICESVTILHQYAIQKTQQTCNTRITFYLLFKLGKYVSLSHEIAKRATQGLKFGQSELLEGVKSLSKAVLWHKSIINQTQELSWNICPENAYYQNGRFCLNDPWISQFGTQQSFKYPSQQRLMFINDQAENFDRNAELLFEVAMTLLQAAKLRTIRRVYSKNTINMNLLKEQIDQCGYPRLREILRQLLLGGIDIRIQYLHFLEANEKKPNQKIALCQKQKMWSRVGSNKKIRLAKYQKQNTASLFQQLLVKKQQLPQMSATEQRRPLQERNKNINITFTYKPYLNAQKLQLRPIQNQIQSVHRCIQKINKKLQNIQNLVSQNLINNSVQKSVVQSKIIASNKAQHQHLQPQSQSNQYYQKVDMPHTHTQDKQTNTNKETEQKDSLHVLMQQYQEEEQNRLTQSYNEATYTVNIKQVNTETSQPLSQAQRQDSLQIRDCPSDQVCGYIFKMQGTQLQGVSKLTIPEEQPEEEESFQEGVEKTPRGQFVVHKNDKGGMYKGYMLNNKRNGLGTFYYLEGGYYEGNWKDNRMNGYGKIYYDSGELAYEGMWYQDEIHGRGKLYNDCAAPLGEAFNYKKLDYQEYHAYEVSYEGDFSHDLRQGFGKLTLSNGEFYSGEFHENNPHGKGYFNGLTSCVYGLWQHGIFIKVL